ncbi:MAG: glycosyltransferase family 4 protein [Ignavibacteriales bacterium]|nr:glycosyltransferase family 4 protein [Ignavibacteriales bacterium]
MRPLNILVDARGTQEGFKQHKHRGIGHYAVQLIRQLQESRTAHRFTFLVDATKPVDRLLAHSDLLRHYPWVRGSRISEFLETQLTLPGTIRTRVFDVVHYLSQHDGARATPFPFILNILDTVQQSAGRLYSFGQNFKHRVLQSIVQRTVDRASAIITISEYSKQDVLRHYRISSEKIHVTHLAADHRFFRATPKKAKAVALASMKLPKEFLFYVGGIDPRKNVRTLMRALFLLYEEHPASPPLVFAGRIDNQTEYSALMQDVERLRLTDRVRFLGFVSDDQLPALFACAKVFVFPSLLEGFGLPVVQAMASGIPVVASATSSIPEVAGDAVFYADVTSADALARAIHHVLTHPREAARKKAAGKRRARLFSWKQTAESTIKVYEHVAMNGNRIRSRPFLSSRGEKGRSK